MDNENLNDLRLYYERKQAEYKAYLKTELQRFKDANNNYLSAVIAEACEHAKNLFEDSNEKAFERFNKSQTVIKKKAEGNYPPVILDQLVKSTKKDLDWSLNFNKDLFDKSVAYYKSLL